MRLVLKLGVGVLTIGLAVALALAISKIDLASAQKGKPAIAPVIPPDDLSNIRVTDLQEMSRDPNARIAGMDMDGKYFVSAGPAPDSFLTITPMGKGPRLTVPIQTMESTVVPGTARIAFTGLGKNASAYPVYLVNDDGSDLQQFGVTETPWDLKVTMKGIVAFREGDALVLFHTGEDQKTIFPLVTLTGTYPTDHTLWSLSPDGQNVALIDGDTLTLINSKSGEHRTIQGRFDRERVKVGTWSLDGELFAYGTEPQKEGEHPALWVTSLFEPERKLFEHPTAGPGKFWDISWIDSNTLVVSYRSNGPLNFTIPSNEYYAVSTTGGAKLLFQNGLGLSISTDGSRLFVSRQAKEGSLDRFTIWQADIVK